jgi:hypothetical protein
VVAFPQNRSHATCAPLPPLQCTPVRTPTSSPYDDDVPPYNGGRSGGGGKEQHMRRAPSKFVPSRLVD